MGRYFPDSVKAETKEMMRLYAGLAYLTVDVPLESIDFDAIDDYFSFIKSLSDKSHSKEKHDEGYYYFDIAPVVTCLTDEGWLKTELRVTDYVERYHENTSPRFMFDLERRLPSLCEALKKLPIKITHANFLRQHRDVDPHFDDMEIAGVLDYQRGPYVQKGWNDVIEPGCYKIILSEKNLDSFYVTPSIESDLKIFPQFDKNFPVFLNSMCNFPHGAVHRPEQRKCVLNIHGVLYLDRHLELIQRSLKKFSSTAIWF